MSVTKGLDLAAMLAALALTFGLYGCASSSLTASQLRAKASGICVAARTQAERIPTPASPARGGAFLEHGIAVLRPELASLRALRAPSDLGAIYATAVRSYSEEARAISATARELGLGADPVAAIEGLQRRLAPLESQGEGAWQALGITACTNR